MAVLFSVKSSRELPITGTRVDAVALCLSTEQMKLKDLSQALPEELHSFIPAIHRLRDKDLFSGKHGQLQCISAFGVYPYDCLLLVGTGTDTDSLRQCAAKAAKAIKEQRLTSLILCLPNIPEVRCESSAQWITEGLLLGLYSAKDYRRDPEKLMELQEVTLWIDERVITDKSVLIAVEESVVLAEICAEATNYARDLTNLPSNYLVPDDLAAEAAKLARTYGLDCQVLGAEEIERLGMGGLRNVGQGSVHPPRMIAITYMGMESWTNVLGLVGKGITFDTGGISLKKAEGMEEMISDMGGAATVLGVMRAVGRLKPRVNIIAVIAAAENMPSGSAYKPGDVITTMSGRTVEVLNTDAEGRVVLADAVTYAKQLGAAKLIDIATLTGAVLVSLGDVATGAVTNDDAFLGQLLEASRRTGERIWQLPAFPEYKEMLHSSIADVKNSTSPARWAGCITGGLFIGVFAEETPWIHLDIGGTAWLMSERGVDPQGGTGAMVRTILQMVLSEGGTQ